MQFPRRGVGYDTAHPRLVNIRAVIHPNTAQTSGTPTTNSSGVWVKLTPFELVLSSTKAKVDLDVASERKASTTVVTKPRARPKTASKAFKLRIDTRSLDWILTTSAQTMSTGL
ncbi:MAG: hypothetical protein ACJA07_003991 [Rhodococcus sp. (in: high G+C Gram-positive bacteria)]|jgi:hypothetical protein